MRLTKKDKRIILAALEASAEWESSYADSLVGVTDPSSQKARLNALLAMDDCRALRARLVAEWDVA